MNIFEQLQDGIDEYTRLRQLLVAVAEQNGGQLVVGKKYLTSNKQLSVREPKDDRVIIIEAKEAR